jgi:uncharacterized protein (TIGR02757 family)
MVLTDGELKEFLDFKAAQYESPEFLTDDPIQLPHLFSKKEDVEIIGLLVSTIAWGNRKSIIQSGKKLIELMDNQPHEFIMNYQGSLSGNFVHRTFSIIDLDYFFHALRNIYHYHGGLESVFGDSSLEPNLKSRILNFRKKMLETTHEKRSEKHLSNPLQGSASKRLVMFLRWMVRSPQKGVDFGIWRSIPTHELFIPLDVHTGNIARKLGLLQRNMNDWQANEELKNRLVEFDAIDPAKYDFALFGIGAYENF